jgi:hypothetical protein
MSNQVIGDTSYSEEENNTDLVGLWIAIGIILAMLIFIAALFLLRLHFRGPIKGSNNPARLDDRTVAITGIKLTLPTYTILYTNEN